MLGEIDLNTARDRAVGCFIGLAVGDALGAPVEFQRPGTFEPVTSYRAGGPFNLNAGEWTDDTSMAIGLGLALVADPFLLMMRCSAIGSIGRGVVRTAIMAAVLTSAIRPHLPSLFLSDANLCRRPILPVTGRSCDWRP